MAGAGMYLSMTGVMRALFEEVETPPMPDDEGTVSIPENPDADPDPPDTSGGKHKTPEPKPRELPTDRHKQKLRQDLDKFFDKFSSEDFSSECTASKLGASGSISPCSRSSGKARWLA